MTITERHYETVRQENMRDQRIRIALARQCATQRCVMPAGHDGHHMRQDGTDA